jgi:hypothetical protein
MRKIALLAVLSLVAVPAAFAENSPSPTEQASTLCKQQRTQMGTAAFKLLYGGASNSYGRCVSKLTSTVGNNAANASKQCAKERADAAFATTHDNRTFAQFYGSSAHGNGNAFGKCVSAKAKALAQAQQESTIAAAKTCKTERTQMGALAFTAKYGNRSNAFGKCVSKTAKATQ